MKFQGQILQDKFVCKVLNNKRNGYFIEIGSNDPIYINNTYVLETELNWKGIMIEKDTKWIKNYLKHRPNSKHIIEDATVINYDELFQNNLVPKNIDYLQIDLEVSNGSTISTLQKICDQVMHEYKFAIITFEHDIYCTNYKNTRLESRKLLKNKGYVRVFSDINYKGKLPFEDWYVHPELVDMRYIYQLIDTNRIKYKKLSFNYEHFDDMSINFEEIIF